MGLQEAVSDFPTKITKELAAFAIKVYAERNEKAHSRIGRLRVANKNQRHTSSEMRRVIEEDLKNICNLASPCYVNDKNKVAALIRYFRWEHLEEYSESADEEYEEEDEGFGVAFARSLAFFMKHYSFALFCLFLGVLIGFCLGPLLI